jgi:hypothetical protein
MFFTMMTVSSIFLTAVVPIDIYNSIEESIRAGEQQSQAIRDFVNESACGLYCLYASARMLGYDIPPEEIITAEYIASGKGSTIDELISAAEDHGLHSAAVKNISPRTLLRTPPPVILYVKRYPFSATYDHYVVYVGSTKGGSHLILDPSGTLLTMSEPDLEVAWSGTGLLVRGAPIKEPIWTLHYSIASGIEQLTLVLIVTLLIIVTSEMVRYSSLLYSKGNISVSNAVVEFVVIIAFVLAFSLFYHIHTAQGFMRNRQAIEHVMLSKGRLFAQRVNEGQVRHLIAENSVIIDARFSRESADAPVEGAINIPPSLDIDTVRTLLTDIERDQVIVVSCGILELTVAEPVLGKLAYLGYPNVYYYEGDLPDRSQ